VPGHLFIVGTPIGNIQDITLRAIDILRKSDLIACEDTRHTKFLLDTHKIDTATTSYHKFNIKAKTKYLIDKLKEGKSIALVSDAGMPGISDPGQELIKAAISAGIKIEVVPGPCAVISALSVSGIGSGRFAFEGFLPAKPSLRKELMDAMASEERSIVLYEAPHRMVSTLKEIKASLGDRQISVARELTKKFEEVIRGSISDVLDKFSLKKPRGEFVIVIEGKRPIGKLHEAPELLVRDMVEAGISKSNAVKIAAKRLNISKNELYKASLSI